MATWSANKVYPDKRKWHRYFKIFPVTIERREDIDRDPIEGGLFRKRVIWGWCWRRRCPPTKHGWRVGYWQYSPIEEEPDRNWIVRQDRGG